MGIITYAVSDVRKQLFSLGKKGYAFRNYEDGSEYADVAPRVGTGQWIAFMCDTDLTNLNKWLSIGISFHAFIKDGVRFVNDSDGSLEEVEDYIIADSIYDGYENIGKPYNWNSF